MRAARLYVAICPVDFWPVRSATPSDVRPFASDIVTNVARRLYAVMCFRAFVFSKSSARLMPAAGRCSSRNFRARWPASSISTNTRALFAGWPFSSCHFDSAATVPGSSVHARGSSVLFVSSSARASHQVKVGPREAQDFARGTHAFARARGSRTGRGRRAARRRCRRSPRTRAARDLRRGAVAILWLWLVEK